MDLQIFVPDTDTHRVCSGCGILKELSEFYKDGKNKRGEVKYRRDCKECYNYTRMLSSHIKKAKKVRK